MPAMPWATRRCTLKALAADCKARGLHLWTNAPASLTANGPLEVDGARVEADAVVPLLAPGGIIAAVVRADPPAAGLLDHGARDASRARPGGVVLCGPGAPLLYAPRRASLAVYCYGEFVPFAGRRPPRRSRRVSKA